MYLEVVIASPLSSGGQRSAVVLRLKREGGERGGGRGKGRREEGRGREREARGKKGKGGREKRK